jgi:hypothetical protein
MAKIEIVKTELVWPGKYNEDGTRRAVEPVNLPFQIIETINESRATREAKKDRQPTLFDVWEGEEGEQLPNRVSRAQGGQTGGGPRLRARARKSYLG